MRGSASIFIRGAVIWLPAVAAAAGLGGWGICQGKLAIQGKRTACGCTSSSFVPAQQPCSRSRSPTLPTCAQHQAHLPAPLLAPLPFGPVDRPLAGLSPRPQPHLAGEAGKQHRHHGSREHLPSRQGGCRDQVAGCMSGVLAWAAGEDSRRRRMAGSAVGCVCGRGSRPGTARVLPLLATALKQAQQQPACCPCLPPTWATYWLWLGSLISCRWLREIGTGSPSACRGRRQVR